MTKSTSRPPTRRVGAEPRIEPEVVRKLFQDSGLTRAQFAALAGASVKQEPNGGYGSSTVNSWLSENRPSRMHAATFDLLVTRIWLWKERGVSLDELANQPLKEVLARHMPKPME